jgi:hypothetical protein
MSPGDSHPADCPAFEYENHPDRPAVLPQRAAGLLADLRRGVLEILAAACDTRPVHGRLFSGLTPVGCDYYAGNYRGQDFRCLRRYHNYLGARACCPPQLVPSRMVQLEQSIRGAIAALDAGWQSPAVAPEMKLLHVVQVACRFFYLIGSHRLHPYANGNGHAARFCLWAILARYGYFPVRWSLEPRPAERSTPLFCSCTARMITRRWSDTSSIALHKGPSR